MNVILRPFQWIAIITLFIGLNAPNVFAMDSEIEKYFNNNELVKSTVTHSINEAAIAGFHGLIYKAEYYLQESKKQPSQAKLFSFIAWWNLLNAHCILDQASIMPINHKLPGQDTKTLVDVMLKTDEIRRQIERDTFKWTKEESSSRYQRGTLYIQSILGVKPQNQ